MTGIGYRFTGSYTRQEVSGLPPAVSEKLTPRLCQVCELVALGKENKVIAGTLKLDESTVRLYVIRILECLGLDRTDNPRVTIARHVVFAWMEHDAAA